MKRQEAERLTRQTDTLVSLGFTRDEADALRRISMTLHRWHERECGDGNGCIEREKQTGIPYWYSANARYVDPHDPRAYCRIPDREAGARKRLAKIIEARNARSETNISYLQEYIQTDPRGAALYILRPGDVPEGEDASAFYNRGVCVY